jgi:hypothetical protein
MSRALYLVPKIIAIAVMVAFAWLVYTNMLSTEPPADTTVTEDAAKTPWVSGYPLTVQNNTKAIPTKDGGKNTKEEASPSATDHTTSTNK